LSPGEIAMDIAMVTAPNGSGGSGGNSGTNESSGSDEPAAIHQVSVKINGVVNRVNAS